MPDPQTGISLSLLSLDTGGLRQKREQLLFGKVGVLEAAGHVSYWNQDF
jgi:hypothetical protein